MNSLNQKPRRWPRRWRGLAGCKTIYPVIGGAEPRHPAGKAAYKIPIARFSGVVSPSNCRAGIKRGGLPFRSSRLLLLLLGLALLVPGFFSPASLLAQTIVQGDVYGTWTTAGIPYIVIADATVPSGQTLTIDPGVTIEIALGVSLTVNGVLSAVGTVIDSIRFTTTEPIPSPGQWGKISFANTSTDPPSELQYCIVEYGGSGSNDYAISVSSTSVKLRISSSLIARNSRGVLLRGASATISNSMIEEQSVYGIRGENGATIEDCFVINNGSTGILIYSGSSPPSTIKSSIIESNSSDGIYVRHDNLGSDPSTIIQSSTIRGNSGSGIYIDEVSRYSAKVSNVIVESCMISENILHGIVNNRSYLIQLTASINVIYDNTLAGISQIGVSSIVERNTLVSNGSGGMINISSSNALIFNNIVANNIGDGLHTTVSPAPATQFNDVFDNTTNYNGFSSLFGSLTTTNRNGDPADVYSNISLDPQFVDAMTNDYHLQQISPAIDAGDTLSEKDPDSTIADLGVYFFNQNDSISPMPPTNLSATPSDREVSLIWDVNTETDLARYYLYRNTVRDSSLLTPIDTLPKAATSSTDTGLANGVTYWYWLSAIDYSGNESLMSAAANATPQDLTSPAAPAGLAATPGDGQITLTWSANSEADFLRYRIYGGTTANPTTQVDSTTGGINDTTATITNLSNGTTYYYRITAVDSAGNESGYSGEVNTTPINYPPTITSLAAVNAIEDVYFKYLATATDPEDSTITWTFDQLPVWLSSSADSAYGTPTEGTVDTSFRVIASDGSLTDTLLVDVTVIPVNDPPVITSAATATATEDVYFKYVATATDPEDSTITWTFDQLPSWLSSSADNAYGTPAEGTVDTSFRVIASDGALTDTMIVAVTVVGISPFQSDSLALAALYDSTDGANWTNNTNWLSPDSAVSTWYGVTVSGRRVTGLSLGANNLSGTIPAELGNLDTLANLYLDMNLLNGTIPTTLGNMINLTRLDLWGNQLTGTIPAELGNLDALVILGLHMNQLSGSIPAELGNLVNLTTLLLFYNQLSGSIPPAMENLTNLTNLAFHNNQLTGLPDLSLLDSLRTLEVQTNRLTFEDLEPNVGVASTLFTYVPQDSVGTEKDTTVYIGSGLTLSVLVGGTANQYQWRKDGADIVGATSDTWAIPSVDFADAGSYSLRTTNTIATDLTLDSRPTNVTVVDLPPPASIIVSTYPAQNALNVSLYSPISVTFGVDINSATINDTTFVVHGGFTGKLGGAYSYDGPSKTATFTPDSPFKVGEQVNVTVTRGVESTEGEVLPSPYSWSFTSEVLGGSGTFTPTVNYDVGDYPRSVTAADLDGDGDIDLAVANANSNNISVLLNSGSGTFAAAVNYGVGAWPTSVIAADLDGDGDADLAVANFNDSTVSVLLNQGSGTFAPSMDYGLGGNLYCVIAADLDGDGDTDLAVVSNGYLPVSVLLNQGNGIFARATNYDAGGNSRSITAADLDNDGDADLVVANSDTNTVSVLLNDGSGSFASAVSYDSGINLVSVTTADLDGDGDTDLAVANDASYHVSVLLNQGNGIFAPKVDYIVGVGLYSIFVIAADLDGDGDPDLAVVNPTDSTVSVLLNQNLFSVRITLNTSVEASDTLDIPYRISNPDSNLTSLICEYSPDDGSTWQSAAVIGDTSTLAPGQYQGTLQWDSYTDLPGEDLTTVQFRITPYDQTGQGRSYTTTPFHLDNNREPVAVMGAVAGEQAGDVAISYTLSDDEGDTLSYTAEYSTDQGNIWQNATVTGLSSNLDYAKYSGQLTWHTLDDLPGHEDSLTYFRIVPSDYEPGTAGEVVFHLDNNQPPSLTLSQVPNNTIISQATIPYVLTDPERDTLAITTEVSFDQGQSWAPSGVGTEYSAIAPADYSGEFSWLAFASVYGEWQDVQLRAIPYDYDPGQGDTLTGLTVIYHIGDYTGDLNIGTDDLALFASAWNATPQNLIYEVGPATGTVPDLTPLPDGVLDFEDLTVFAMMWNWSFANNGFAKSISLLAKAASGATSLTLVQRIPDNLWAKGATDMLTVDVYVDSEDPLMMVDGVLSFDPLMVKYVGIEEGGYLRQYYQSTPMFAQVSPDSSRVLFAVVGLGKLGEAQETGLPVATVRFKPVTKTTHNLSLTYALRDESGDKVEQNLALVELESLLPEQFVLHQNYPNPFNPNTSLRYELPIATDVVLVVYDILGREVIRLVDAHNEAGYHQVIWQGQDRFGRGLASGVYIYRIVTPQFSRANKMLLLK